MNDTVICCTCCVKPIDVEPLGVLIEVDEWAESVTYYHSCAFCGAEIEFAVSASAPPLFVRWVSCQHPGLRWLGTLI